MDPDRWRRAADVFEAALDRPEADQRAYVDEACGGDVDLRREVEALIDEDRRSSPLDVPISSEALASLSFVKNIGPYHLETLLGAGGMGEVYRARDSRLGREVAIKILPAAFAGDRERLARLKREAQLLASLNHPNIASIYGFEADGAVEALVLELVEGPTLADRLADGPLAIDEALAIARQIADALGAAHEAGIVHRDLKPANVKVREDGTVKVLDFGLAKVADAGRTVAHRSMESPTITTPAMTAAGIILGTAAYMAPEQAKGKTADRRSDIWAFGCVLYEMLTGRRAFEGDDVSDTMAAILRSEPDWTVLGTSTSPAVRRVLRRCLEKEPGKRYHAIADAQLDLAEPAPVAPPPSVTRSPVRERLAWASVAALIVGGVAYLMTRQPPAIAPTVRFQLAPPEKGFFGSVGGTAGGFSGATMSPDGTQLAFVATDQSGKSSVWVRALEAKTARMLTETVNAALPFWSPNGRSLGFFAGGKLKIVDVATGSAREIADAAPGRGASWGSRDIIVFSRGNPAQMARISANGGAVTPILDAPRGAAVLQQPLWPKFLPDGRHFIYWSALQVDGGAGIAIGSIDPDFVPRPLVRSDTAGAIMLPGTLLFARGQTLLQQPFDPNSMQLSGEATPVNEQVLTIQGAGIADFSVSAGGAFVYQSGTIASNQFAWIDRTGKQIETVSERGRYRTLALSPNGKRLAYEDSTKGDISILDLERGTTSRFTSGPGQEACPVWFPDGSKIAYRSETGGIFVKDASGTSPERRLLDSFVNGPSQVTSDGKWLLYFWVPPHGQSQDVAALALTGEPTPRTLIESPFPDVEPQISPDNRWLAYASTETGRNEIYVQPFPPTGPRWQISSAGGRQPLWRGDSKELFFVADDRRFYAVDVKPAGDSVDFGVPHFLFDMRANVFNVRNSYIPSPDGQRFLVNTLIDNTGEPLTVILNWKPR